VDIWFLWIHSKVFSTHQTKRCNIEYY